MKRLGIFVYFDKDGIVDDYIPYLLNGLKPHIERFIIVINGDVNPRGKEKLLKFAKEEDLIFRENKGFDTWAYKTGMDHAGWDELSKYDETIIFNDTVMGPVFPFSEMFDEMEKRHPDFWGITRHYSDPGDPYHCVYGHIPEHIQSYFCAFGKRMIDAPEFREYWDNLFPINSYEDAVGKHEIVFTKKFADMGFTWDTYINSEELKALHVQPIIALADRILKKERCPIFKKRVFFQDYDWTVKTNVGQIARDLYDYVDKETDYPAEYILETLLRSRNLYELSLNLHWNRVLPEDGISAEPGRLSADTDYVYHTHPFPDIYAMTNPYLRYKEERCLQGSEVYINNIHELFKKEKKLGLVTTPMPNHANLLDIPKNSWRDFYGEVKREADRIGLTVPITENEMPIIVPDLCFYVRKELYPELKEKMDEILNNEGIAKDRRISILERLIPFLIQQKGYYTAQVMPQSFAEIEIDNLRFKLSDPYTSGETKYYNDQINDLRRQIEGYENSISWKVTKPLRAVMRFIRKLLHKE